MSSPGALEWSPLLARIYHCGSSRQRCLYRTRDARKQGERALMRQLTVSWMHDPLQAFSFSLKNLPPSLRINIANKQPLRMCLVHADYFVEPLAIMCIIFCCKIPAALCLAGTSTRLEPVVWVAADSYWTAHNANVAYQVDRSVVLWSVKGLVLYRVAKWILH